MHRHIHPARPSQYEQSGKDRQAHQHVEAGPGDIPGRKMNDRREQTNRGPEPGDQQEDPRTPNDVGAPIPDRIWQELSGFGAKEDRRLDLHER